MIQESFFDAIEKKDTRLVQETLAKGADVNGLSESGTALYLSIKSGNSEITKLLVENRADCNIVQLDFDHGRQDLKDGLKHSYHGFSTAIDFLCRKNDTKNDEILNYLLENRPMISKDMVDQRIFYCTQLLGSGDDEMLFDYAASYLLRKNMYDHLHPLGDQNFPLAIVAALCNMDAEVDGEPLDGGGTHEAYLTIIIRSLFEQLVRFKLHKDSAIKSEEQYKQILRELLHDLEAYNLLMDVNCIPREPPERLDAFYSSIINNIIHKLQKKMENKQEYTLPVKWGAHAVCVNFVRVSEPNHDRIVIRIDNLSKWDEKEHKTDSNEKDPSIMIPQILGEIPLDELGFKREYFKSLLKCMKADTIDEADGIQRVYHNDALKNLNNGVTKMIIDELKEQAERLKCFKIQARSNCYCKSHEPGLAIRSNDYDIFQKIKESQQVYAMKLVTKTKVDLFKKSEDLKCQLKFYWEKERTIRFKAIRQKYQKYSIERIMNPAKQFSIEQSYINLAIVGTKEQKEKESKLHDAKPDELGIGTFEEIYGPKKVIQVKDMFEECKGDIKSVLVFGRAGIGKTTFCKYIAHQWATGKLWSRYHLVVLISLRSLTENNYPPVKNKNYSLIDLLEKEYYSCSEASKEDKRFFEDQCSQHQILWLLDGYDEFGQNVPDYLNKLFEHLRTTQHHILTSRPYLNTLPYDVQMEITGFTDNNIKDYVKQFFDQIKDQLSDASSKSQKLLDFLQLNPRIWGVAHIPINLELICSLWSDTDWSETTTLTMTTLYDKMTEWLCRRHLEKQNISLNHETKETVYAHDHIHKKLAFLESLAFNGMESKSIILEPKLLRTALNESGCSSDSLNIGILKSLDYKPTGTCIETDKKHYFLHLSFQEHFAARYLVKAFKGTPVEKKKAIDFIKTNKYNQRFELVFTFASGLLIDPIDSIDEQCRNLFWEILLGEPLDLVGFRHVQIVIACLDEAGGDRQIPHFKELMNSIIQWIKYHIFVDHYSSDRQFFASLKRSPSLVNQPEILDTFIKLYNAEDIRIRDRLCSLISDLPISNPDKEWINFHLKLLSDNDMHIKISACRAFEKMDADKVNDEVIEKLLILSRDMDDEPTNEACRTHANRWDNEAFDPEIERQIQINDQVRSGARKALVKMGKRAATNKVINRISIRLNDTDAGLRSSVSQILGEMGEKAAANEVISELSIRLGDTNNIVKSNACQALAKMGEKAATDKVISELSILLGDTNYQVRSSAKEALAKMGEKAATDKVISELSILLGDTNYQVRSSAKEALAKMGEKAANHEVIKKLLILLDDRNDEIRVSACEALKNMGEKAATVEVSSKLSTLLGDPNNKIRRGACEALKNMGEKAATKEVIKNLLILFDDTDGLVRTYAREALEEIGQKAPTDEVIKKFLILLDNKAWFVRSRACIALDKMGQKTSRIEVIKEILVLTDDNGLFDKSRACIATDEMGQKVSSDEVIKEILILLDDGCWIDRIDACRALAKMGKKAANHEVISKLSILLDDRDYKVRSSAKEALAKMGEKTAIDETIRKLIILLSDKAWHQRKSACERLIEMGEEAVTDEVISQLSILLDDTDYEVRISATKALAKMGEKAANDKVIDRLSILFSDRNNEVRISACDALAEMGETTATNKVVNKLLILLDNTNANVRRSVCSAFAKMCEKAGNDKVIDRLSILFSDRNNEVRISACDALAEMGGATATNKVVNKLLILHDNTNANVRRSACSVFAKIGGKAANDELINKLLILLDNTNASVRNSACDALAKMGGKAATNEVIERLLDAYHLEDSSSEFQIRYTMETILDLLPSLLDLKDESRVQKLSMCIQKMYHPFLKNTSPEKFITAFLITKIELWLPIIKKVFILHNYGITVTENTIIIYGSREPIKLTYSEREFGQQLKDLKNFSVIG